MNTRTLELKMKYRLFFAAQLEYAIMQLATNNVHEYRRLYNWIVVAK